MARHGVRRLHISPKAPEPSVVLPEVTGQGRVESAEFIIDKRELLGEVKPMKLANKIALVTGAGSRIGRMTALLFAREGAKVVAVDVNGGAARDTVRLATEMHAEAVHIEANLSRASEAERVIATTVDSFGRLDVVFNYATMEQDVVNRRLEEIPESDWDRIMAETVKRIFLVAKYAIPVLRRGGGGVIVNSSSVLGLVGFDVSAAYCAAQGGVVQLTRQMAVECARDKIRVNAVAPTFLDGATAEEFSKQSDSVANARRLMDLHPIGRLGKPEDVAEAVLYLASAEADFITGVILPVDGGYTAR